MENDDSMKMEINAKEKYRRKFQEQQKTTDKFTSEMKELHKSCHLTQNSVIMLWIYHVILQSQVRSIHITDNLIL